MNFSSAINQGFQTAKQSFQGIFIYLLGSGLSMALVGGLFILTSPPLKEIKQAYTQSRQRESRQAPIQRLAANISQDMTAPDSTSVASKKGNPFSTNPAIRKWFSQSWPVILMMGLLAIILWSYLYSWRMNYVACLTRGKEFVLSDSFGDAGVLLVHYIKAYFLGIGFLIAVLGVAVGLCALCFWLMAKTLAGLLTFLIISATVVGFIWLSVLLAFWYPAMACERSGVLAGIRASFFATRSRIFPLIGFYLILALIHMGINIAARILAAVVGVVIGILHLPIVFSIIVILGITSIVAICFEFFQTSAYFHYYLGVCSEDAWPIQSM